MHVTNFVTITFDSDEEAILYGDAALEAMRKGIPSQPGGISREDYRYIHEVAIQMWKGDHEDEVFDEKDLPFDYIVYQSAAIPSILASSYEHLRQSRQQT